MGTLVVAQSGGPTAVMNASLVGAIAGARGDRRVDRILGARFGIEGILADDYVDLTELPTEALVALKETPGAGLGSSRYRASDTEIHRIVSALVARDASWLLTIGGNDTADTLHRIQLAAQDAGLPLSVVGIPKTIDNDLPGMDHCPGYGSAARYVAVAVREAGIDTCAMQRTDPVKIVEVMGRNAGWLAAAARLGRHEPDQAPQLVFFPERPRSVEQMVDEIAGAYRAHGWAVVVVSENQTDEAGRPLAGDQPVHIDPHGHRYNESPGAHLARLVQSTFGVRARYERPGSLQRTSTTIVSETDAIEARLAGVDAVKRALRGESDVMVAIQREPGLAYSVRYEATPLSEIAARERHLPDEFIASSGTDVTDAFLAYVRPLIGGSLPPILSLV
ncbi:MAG: diphosphate--fructose-6-phosphate 1-phosphotransferase [Chloroflexi bacterium]|nr:diphosphate--fructose-6-phosphate 1-phosphotransferase [Chloroflexota bacterium]